MNLLKLSCYLFVLIISCHSLAEAGESEEESVPGEQTVESKVSNTASKGRSNDRPNFVGQLFSQSLIPSLSYDRKQSISHNIGYNLGRNVGRTPFVGASLDPQADASKVVLVLANDTPETSALPQPDATTLKRLVRTPQFLDEFVSQMAMIKDQISQKVPAFSRTMGIGFNEVLGQAPLLSQVQQSGAIDYARLGQTFGESLLPENMFAGVGDVFNFTLPQNGDSQAPPTETERAASDEGDQAEGDSAVGAALQNPFDNLFRNFQPFVPPPLPPIADNNPFMFNPAQTWSWLPPNLALDGAASGISEVRVKPEVSSPYKIAPKEAAAQKMTEMKLRAAMTDALNKKTIPILWFRMPEETSKTLDKSMSKTDEDLKMQMKLEAFEKQLILELQQLQEVVKLANAMKKAQLESKGKKYQTTQSVVPLGLCNTPIYKITLDDIEKTLKDEYVQKLLQMISNSQKMEKLQKGPTATDNAKYTADMTGNPNKRQTPTGGTMAAALSKEDMLNMMAYAYRMAAANGQEMPWLKGDNAQTLDDPSKATQPVSAQQLEQRQRMDQLPQMANEQQWLMEKQQKMSMDAEQEIAMAEERKLKGGGGGHHHHHHHSHSGNHHHHGRKSDDMIATEGSNNDDQQMMQMPQVQQMRQGGWLTNDGQQKMTMPQDQQMRQGGWLTNDGQKMISMPQDQQMRQGGWLTNDGQKMMQMPQDQQMRQGGWLTNDGQKMMQMPQDQQMRQGGWLTNDGQKMMQMPQDQQMRQGGWLTNDGQKMMQMPQDQQMRQGGWLTNDGQKMMQMPQDQQMRQGGWLTNDGQKMMQMPQDQQMRQGGWLTNDGQKMMQMPQDQQMRQGEMTTMPMGNMADQRQWLEPNTQQMKQPMEQQMKQQAFEGPEAQMQRFMPNNAEAPQQQMRQMNMAQQQQPATMTNTNPNANIQMRQQEWGIAAERQPDTNQAPQTPGTDSKAEEMMPMAQQRQMLPQQMGQTANTGEQMGKLTDERQMTTMEMNEQPQMAKSADQAQPAPAMERQGDNQNERKTEQHTMMTSDERQMANHNPAMPIGGEATPQMPENAGKARHKGFEDLFDDFDLFGHHDKKNKEKDKGKGTVINYYYNTGGSRYPPVYGPPPVSYGGGYGPPPAPSYGYVGGGGYGGGGGGYAMPRPSYGGYAKPSYGGGGGYAAPPKYKPSGQYGGGGRGGNAYGSQGGYRTAIGDDEIEEMLKEHQSMPKMMLLTRPDDDNKPAIENHPTLQGSPRTTTTTLDASSTDKADFKNQTKRPRQKSRRRSRRSATEYATLEPIDESSLSELRKTYKNTLKEITLNPNETPSEALMRYNAESVREALAKANKQPMEITAGDDAEDSDQNTNNEESAQGQYGVDSGYITVPSTHAHGHIHLHSLQHSPALNDLSQYHQYVPQINTHHHSAAQLNSFSQQHHHQQQQHFNVVPSLHSYQAKSLPHNPYISVLNSYEPVPFMDDYNVQQSPYQLSNDNGLYTTIHPAKSYVQPEVSYSTRAHPVPARLSNVANSLSKYQQDSLYVPNSYAAEYTHFKAPPSRVYSHNSINKSPHHNNPFRLVNSIPKLAKNYDRHYKHDQGFDSLFEMLKHRLSECCNECKENLLKGLEETLKQPRRGHFPKHVYSAEEKAVLKSFNKAQSTKDSDNKFRDWLLEMSGKGYDKHYLTKAHQREYMRNGRFQLALSEHDHDEELLYGQNQSFKRDTTIAETDTDTELLTPEPPNENNLKKDDEEQEEGQDVDDTVHNINDKNENNKNALKEKTSSKTHQLEPAESTTHSIYALRGKYKPRNRNIASSSYSKNHGKKFVAHKNLKKLGDATSLSKSKTLTNEVSKMMSRENDIEKHKNLEDILDFLYDLSKVNKEKKLKASTESSKTTTISSTTVKAITEDTTATATMATEKRTTASASSRSTQRVKGSTNSLVSTVSSSLTKPKRRKLKPKPTKAAISKDLEISIEIEK